MKIIEFIRKDPIALLIIAIPIAMMARIYGWGDIWVFTLSATGVIPMAHFIGVATKVLADHTGPRIGGLLNATLGNAAELIITIFAIKEGLLELVKASITGSILGNLLLVLGMSMVYGGLRFGVQSFDRRQASHNSILLTLAVIALLIPSVFSHYIGNEGSVKVEAFSLGVAGIMILLYALGVIFSLKASGNQSKSTDAADLHVQRDSRWSLRQSIIMLCLSTAGVAYLSELLVGSVEPVVAGLGISEFFLGIILVPIIGNVAEHLVAIQVAGQNNMDLSVEISIASSLQIALFVAPVLVFVSLIMGNPLTLIFNQLELLALIAGVIITALVSMDGESNWLEGAELLAVYAILGLAFFLLPV